MKQRPSLLILGGTNYVGKHLIENLKNCNFNISILTRGNKPLPDKIEFLNGDRNNKDSIRLALKDRYFDTIIDLSGYQPIHFEFVLDCCDFRQYIFISSSAIYKKSEISPQENSPKCDKDSNAYGYDKLRTEDVIISNARDKGYNYVILRPVYIYGLDDPNSRELIIFKKLHKNSIEVIGDGNNFLQFIYITDLINIIKIFIGSDLNIVINVADEDKITVLDIIRICATVSNIKHYNLNYIQDSQLIDYKKYTPFPSENRVANTDLLKTFYNKTINFKDGIKQTYEFLKLNNRI